MKLSIPPSNGFDKKIFADYLVKIKGTSSIIEFSANCDISRDHMGKMLSGYFNNPPHLSTIKRISAYASKLGYSFEEIAAAAGYSQEDLTLYESKLPNPIVEKKKDFTGIIMHSLSFLTVPWTFLPSSSFPLCSSPLSVDLGITVPGRNWYFSYLSEEPMKKRDSLLVDRQIDDILIAMVSSKFPDNSKLSLVTDSKHLNGLLVPLKPQMLAMKVSVILVDPKKNCVSKEENLVTNIKSTKNEETILLV